MSHTVLDRQAPCQGSHLQFTYSSLVAIRFSSILLILSPNPLPEPPVVISGAEAFMKCLLGREGAQYCESWRSGNTPPATDRVGALPERERETILHLRDFRTLRSSGG